MDALRNPKSNLKARLALFGAAILVLTFAFALSAEAKCTTRVGDDLIRERYACKSKGFISYLHNNIITPFSFDCAKKLKETCREEGCANPASDDERLRCLGRYVDVLNGCKKQIEDAAVMARCTDTNEWPVAAVIAPAKANLVVAEPAPKAETPIAAPPTVAETAPVEPAGLYSPSIPTVIYGPPRTPAGNEPLELAPRAIPVPVDATRLPVKTVIRTSQSTKRRQSKR